MEEEQGQAFSGGFSQVEIQVVYLHFSSFAFYLFLVPFLEYHCLMGNCLDRNFELSLKLSLL